MGAGTEIVDRERHALRRYCERVGATVNANFGIAAISARQVAAEIAQACRFVGG